MNKYTVIMAGGGGTRFWPLSRQSMPKQLLNLSGEDAMINETIKRCASIIDIENMFIVTNKSQVEPIEKVLVDGFPKENILQEPVSRNTAPCILYAALNIMEKHGDGIMCIFPSDHYVTDGNNYLKLLEKAMDTAYSTDSVVTIGIEPSYPATGYGYIKRSGTIVNDGIYKIERFVEKPNLEKANNYIKDGKYYWNSGVFIFKVSVIIELFKRFLPRIYNLMSELKGNFFSDNFYDLLNEIYPKLESISIDYGIMERIDTGLIIPGNFGWNDVGSWDSLGAVFPSDEKGNILKADHIGVDTKECIIYGNKKLIATVGLFNVVVVDTDDAILICNKNRAQDVKQIVDTLKEQGRVNLL